MLPACVPHFDFMPSPVPDKPGLLIRDPFQFSDAALVIPPGLVESLTYFDGTRSQRERENLRTPAPDIPRIPRSSRPLCVNTNAKDTVPFTGRIRAIAAPHVSPYGGVDAYRAAYASLTSSDAEKDFADRTFVVLGTSHYGESDRFGLTRKAFRSPLGETSTNLALVDEIARTAGDGILMEDYCHAVGDLHRVSGGVSAASVWPAARVVPVLPRASRAECRRVRSPK